MNGSPPLASFPVGIPTLTGVHGTYTLPAHFRGVGIWDDWDLWFVERGQVVWELKNGRCLRAGKDDFLLLPPLTLIRSRTLRSPVAHWFCHFGFRPIPTRIYWGALREDCGENDRTIVVPLTFSRREAPNVWRSFRDLVRCQSPRRPDSPLWRMEQVGIRLVSELARFACRRRATPTGEQVLTAAGNPDPRVAEICLQIRTNPGFRWKIESIARTLALSAGHLNALCHATLGKSLKSHIGEVRMQRALQLLRSRSQAGPPSLKEICAACGFSSRQFFNRRFKKFYGIPPAMARKQIHLT